ncbi:MAG: tRNA lysidine(34) synthetase TilS, partial [Magnetococcales bacterium]|nr:tRNA lysidine(34) synthetase TilS [Magnetococcales bacterium]
MTGARDAGVRRLIREAGAWFVPGARVIAAFSGGADSTALLHLLLSSGLVPRERLTAAHFDHALRPESAQEAEITRRRAEALGIAWVGQRWERSGGGEGSEAG